MQSPNNREEGAPSGHLSSPNADISSGNGLHVAELLVPGKPPTLQLLQRLLVARHKLMVKPHC